MAEQIEPAAEFQKLPLEMIIGSTLTAVTKAQAIVARSTLDFVLSLFETPPPPAGAPPAAIVPPGAIASVGPQSPKVVQLSVEKTTTDAQGVPHSERATVNVPLIAMVPIPSLNVDSVTVSFKYEVSQTFRDQTQTNGSASVDISSGALVSPWVNATLHGNLSHSSSSDATTNRGGTLDIMVRASQAPLPVGLERLLTMLSQAIPAAK